MALDPPAPASPVPSFKVVFVGDQAVGKTSIIKAYGKQPFFEDRPPTIGSAFMDCRVEARDGPATLQLWDTAGQERYRSLVPMYTRGACVAIIVFDLTAPESFASLDGWIGQVRTDVNPECAIVVAGNKADLEPRIDIAAIDCWAQKRGFDVMQVSAKTGRNINGLFDLVIERLPVAKFKLNNPVDALSFTSKRRERKWRIC
jgi:small GTP-binding protein